jgi:hypothetical protein
VKQILTVGASLMLLFVPAHTAVASPTPPSGDKLFEVSCDSTTNDHQLHSLNVRAGTRTPIGNGSGGIFGSGCARQGAIKPGTDWFYFPDVDLQALSRVNLVSGEIELVAPVLNNTEPVRLASLAIDDEGNAYGLTRSNLYSLDLLTGAVSDEKPADIVALSGGFPNGFAYDGKTNEFYVVENQGGLFRLDVSTGDLTLLATNPDFWVASMAFDSRGRMWVNGDDGLANLNLANFGNSARWSYIPDLSPDVHSESLAIRRPQTSTNENLANTGVAEIAPMVIVGLGVAVLAFAIRRRSA